MTKTNNRLVIAIVVIAAILAGLSFIGLLILPENTMGGPDIPHLSIYWLVLGITHCVLVLFLLGYWLVKSSKVKGMKRYTSIEGGLIIVIVILWLLLIESSVRIGYLRNRIIKVPQNMLPRAIEPNN